MLECFNDWPRQTIEIFQHTTSYDPNTGVETEGYAIRESREVFIFQKSAVQNVFAESIVDQLALIVVTDEAIDNTDLIKYAGIWYSVAYPDDILGLGEVTTIGLVKIKAPASVTGEAPDVDVLGDSGGLV
ncbi:MAG: hypothetical protein M0P29_12930 [Sphaerochaetaceae bacterium]|nr:hypothetical protein [Sphaerochaetaceae bacterium]